MTQYQKRVLALLFVSGVLVGAGLGLLLTSGGTETVSQPVEIARADQQNVSTNSSEPEALPKETNPSNESRATTEKRITTENLSGNQTKSQSKEPQPTAHSQLVQDTPPSLQKTSLEASTPMGGTEFMSRETAEGLVLKFKVRGNLYDAVYKAANSRFGYTRSKSDVLAAHIKRILMWNLPRLRRDVFAGDGVQVLFKETEDTDDGIRILALRYRSLKLRKVLTAYYFKRKGRKFGSFYTAEGKSVAKRMKNAPVKEYEQITSLLGDERHHQGIDFKAPIGTPIYLPFSGRVLRRNWSTRNNGYCLHVRYAKDGTHALFLHLNTISKIAKPGAYLKAGTQIATVGNTGRSFAPHLHYQLEKPRGRVIDPFKWHGYYYEHLKGKELAQFKALVRKYNALLGDWEL